jgi:hypothetical protein
VAVAISNGRRTKNRCRREEKRREEKRREEKRSSLLFLARK